VTAIIKLALLPFSYVMLYLGPPYSVLFHAIPLLALAVAARREFGGGNSRNDSGNPARRIGSLGRFGLVSPFRRARTRNAQTTRDRAVSAAVALN
jgi:hypothetical protein